ncbi:MAG: Gfo/Idh/MocA family oxidoreductase [Alphaproteobacteria bacterium]|nr:Gfo/Idh/MocA family oxidoreductase [Alphaproteobacteria bacterium]
MLEVMKEREGAWPRGSDEPIAVGVVGAGVFGGYHARKYASIPGARLVAIADPSGAAAERLAGELKVDAIDNARALVGRVEAVSIASPAVTHFELARSFLSAGIHVLVEKPLSLNLAEADELIALAEARDLTLQVGHQERYVLNDLGLKDRRPRPVAIEAVRAAPFAGRGDDVSVTLDLMTHDLDMMHALVPGDVMALEAEGRSILEGPHVDEVTARLTLTGGARVRLHASRVAKTRERLLRLTYPDGEIEIDFVARTLKNTTPTPLKAAFGGEGGAGAVVSDPLGYGLNAFLASVRTGARPLIDGHAARRALASALAIDAAVASARP